MMPYDSYRLYQIQRAKSSAEIRCADEQAGRLASAVSSLFRIGRSGARGAHDHIGRILRARWSGSVGLRAGDGRVGRARRYGLW
jgi:hypothetical protein